MVGFDGRMGEEDLREGLEKIMREEDVNDQVNTIFIGTKNDRATFLSALLNLFHIILGRFGCITFFKANTVDYFVQKGNSSIDPESALIQNLILGRVYIKEQMIYCNQYYVSEHIAATRERMLSSLENKSATHKVVDFQAMRDVRFNPTVYFIIS